MEHEGIKIEYKREYIDNFKYTVAAFANTDGGEIFFGIDNDGSICGILDIDATMLKITNVVRDSIRPDISLFTKCENIVMENKNVIRLTVFRGTARPYYISGKGLRPEGVFVRQGAFSVPASDTAIRKMIQESSDFVYENERSMNQELSFSYCEGVFSSRSMEFSEAQKRTLGLVSSDGMFTNLALLLSDQCPHIIKVARFSGSTKTTFQNRREFTGSLLRQLDEAFAFLDMCNQTASEIRGLERIDMRDYPGDAIRETLINLIVHRDYSVFSPAIISIFDDRMEAVSVGGLVDGVSLDDIMLGVSVARNQKLANLFYRLHLIEAYGTGILKINESYSEEFAKPNFQVSSNAFKVTLPNANFARHEQMQLPRRQVSYKIPKSGSCQVRDSVLQALFEQNQFVSRKDIESSLETSQANAVLILRKMLDEGKISKVGSGKNVRYTIRR